ncbi:recombinase family protein [Bradyrhizobium diazoefficiens]|nr:recombinase family protein [Bradyrhizobium diazoefficiens]WRJ02639.1 recombinase family protein [Bradyrhizobium diazoefficiens]WRJ10885.1 recombinase family protein [Bradyrhizobium diazoefficiens]WRJ19156.1 recombinase family protein [Bradyrhizobium diazoefficiens]WRJ27409.1 recombinase family protein [Bradyrhizobium diazoefficiens]WRJ35670.1 recombinase family protein [Bradyrhizobium diazoefficiens]
MCRAVQYVRMSTERQQYSIENQAAAIAAYAHAHNLTIVRTYRDEGESGLRIKNRAGLSRLIEDVQGGNADFGHILVYDISRWGRFQDMDESAHYEFICRQAGVKVAYCAEQFDNDGSMLSSIVKNLKRVMAAEYSRDLSTKVHAGACRFARLGVTPGGPSIYGLHRILVDENLQPKGVVLKRGERKYLTTDHVRFGPGSDEEVAVVRWIFNEFLKVKSETAIARKLNKAAILTGTGGLWDGTAIGRLIRDERYIGNLIYNRSSHKLGTKLGPNPPDVWIRSEGCIEPIVDLEVFLKARQIIRQRRPNLSDEQMLSGLRRTLAKRGRLSPTVIDETPGLPSSTVYHRRFGSLRNAYRLIGYAGERNCDYVDSRQIWENLRTKLASDIASEVGKMGGRIRIGHPRGCMHVEGSASIVVRVARWFKTEGGCPKWSIQRQSRDPLPPGWIAAIRLAEDNKSVLDYVLLPTSGQERQQIRFSERARTKRAIEQFDTAHQLARSLSRRLTKKSRVSRAMPAPLSKRPKINQPKTKSGRARH